MSAPAGLIGVSSVAAGSLARGVQSIHQGPMPPWRDEEVEAEEYARDPRQFLLDRCALWTPHCVIMQNLVCCAVYYLPLFDILPNGQRWYRADKTHDEAIWQGKVGLVVGKGPLAFVDEPGINFHGQNVEIGEWVQWDIHDARQGTIDRISVRYVKDVHIIAKWDDPRIVY